MGGSHGRAVPRRLLVDQCRGAAVFAGGPYDCAQGASRTALTACTLPVLGPRPTAPLVTSHVARGRPESLIDDPSNLASQRVFLFGGADDETVSPVVMDALASYYGAFLPGTSIQYVSRRPGTGHTMPTLDYGGPCDQSVAPWIGQCGYDGAGAALAQIYGTLSPRADERDRRLATLPQGMFAANPASLGLGDTAYVYVPASCAARATCKVHVAFHGCEQEASGVVGTQFVQHAGYNEWADTNAIVVVYPQTLASAASPENPEACWDWWGYDGADYAQKKGAQMAMVRAMLGYLAGAPASGDAGAGQGG